MPRRYFRHRCTTGKVVEENLSPCWTCGAAGEFTGWGFSMVEQWGHFSQLYGLPPFGPHYCFVTSQGLTEPCSCCQGKGLFDVDQGRTYESCGVCRGVGMLRCCTPADLEAVQQIACLIIKHCEEKVGPAGEGQEPVDQVFALVAEEAIRRAARRLLDQRRFTEVTRILTWQGILDPEVTPKAEYEPDGEDGEEQDEGYTWRFVDAEEDQRPAPFSEADLIREVERLRKLGVLEE